MTGTHDTEPLAGWWDSLTAEERMPFGIEAPHYDGAVRDYLLEKIYQAGSNLLLLPIQDVFGWRDRINLPGTIGADNWTYVLPWPCDTLNSQPEAIERAARLAGLSCQTGRWHPPAESGE
jgi:4-alpha-glucanotransferase